MPDQLIHRRPRVGASELLAELVPPPQFADARFENYRPQPEFPSQAEALGNLERFVTETDEGSEGFWRLGRKGQKRLLGRYLDGGFGVGKTHLLAAAWHAASGRKYFASFISYTALVGALGYAQALELLGGTDLLCVDEFELDDPGDTMLITRLLGALMASGTRVIATSNTEPSALGEGRFAAADFLREIQAMAAQFETLRIDGMDYRRRDISGGAVTLAPDKLIDGIRARERAGQVVSRDDFSDLVQHLGLEHPSKFFALIRGVDAIALSDVVALHNQNDSLRWVAFIDRVYDAQIPILASGLPLNDIFDDDMLGGGFRKKYLRSISRMVALTAAGQELA